MTKEETREFIICLRNQIVSKLNNGETDIDSLVEEIAKIILNSDVYINSHKIKPYWIEAYIYHANFQDKLTHQNYNQMESFIVDFHKSIYGYVKTKNRSGMDLCFGYNNMYFSFLIKTAEYNNEYFKQSKLIEIIKCKDGNSFEIEYNGITRIYKHVRIFNMCNNNNHFNNKHYAFYKEQFNSNINRTSYYEYSKHFNYLKYHENIR